MATRKVQCRVEPIIFAYLEDLVRIGVGKDQTAVARKYIDAGIFDAISKGLIEKRFIENFPSVRKPRKRKEPSPTG